MDGDFDMPLLEKHFQDSVQNSEIRKSANKAILISKALKTKKKLAYLLTKLLTEHFILVQI